MTNSGERFELAVYSMVSWAVQQGALGLSAENAEVFHHRAYPSRDRGSSIVVDVSIEVCRRGVKTPFLIWIWE
jgi:hypothetical protein